MELSTNGTGRHPFKVKMLGSIPTSSTKFFIKGTNMAKQYRFECYDDEDNTTTIVEVDTENPCWDGLDGPMFNFFNFLKGCGFVFGINTEIGVNTRKNGFRSANPN